jgi:hypothetical protein
MYAQAAMRFSKLLAASLLVCTVSAPGVFASTITNLNENFDELTPGPTKTVIGTTFVTINGTNVDIVGADNGSFFPQLCVSSESGNCIDLDGSGGNPVGQLQSANEFAAGNYLLSFDLIGNQRTSGTTSATVTLGNYSDTFVLSEFDDSDGIVVNQPVTVSTPGYLLFVSNDPAGDQSGQLLDNVVVTSATSSVPEPSSLVFLSGVLLGVVALRRRSSNTF